MVYDVMMEHMTSPRIREAIANGADTALVMLGSTEQHGPHLPIATDALIAEWVGVRIASRLGATLMAPVIRPGCSDHHMAFSGTISLKRETLKAILRDYCDTLAKHGFRKILIITIHGGNMPAMVEVAPEVARAHPEIEIHVMTKAEPMLQGVGEVEDRLGVDRLAGGAHAGQVETSLVLAGAPQLAEMDRVQAGLRAPEEVWAQAAHTEGLQAVTPNGILGDPTVGCSPEDGYAYIEGLVSTHVREYREGKMRILP
jgi:creatinine amidohydrolase